MHILFDINVVLDVLLNRKPWVTEAAAVWRAKDEGQIVGYILASAMTDIFYIARRLAGLEIARTTVRTCLEAFGFVQLIVRLWSKRRCYREMTLKIICKSLAPVLRELMQL